MNYAQIISHILAFYMLGCGIGFAVNARDGDARAMAFFLGAVFLTFDVIFGGQAKHYGWGWYFINAVSDWVIAFGAVFIGAPVIRNTPRTTAGQRICIYIAWLAVAATFLDLIYDYASAFDHKLPGVWYFRFSNVIESCEVLTLTVLSAPILSLLSKTGAAMASLIHRVAKGTGLWMQPSKTYRLR